MPYELFLALRYLRARRARRLVHVTALAAILGIAFGVAALIVALALANGFRDEMREKILSGTAHITIVRADGQPMPDYAAVETRIQKVQDVTSVSATTYDGAVLNGPRGSAYAVLRGVERASQPGHLKPGMLIEGEFNSLFEQPGNQAKESRLPNVILGAELAERTGLQVGDVGQVILARAGIGTMTPLDKRVRVSGVFRSGLFEYDSAWIYLALDTTAAFQGSDGAASALSVKVENIYEVKRVAASLRAALGKAYTTLDWQEANRPLFTALALERRMALIIIALIILIAALNITTTLVLVVVDRRADIAIISAMGSTSRQIMTIFIIEGAIIGALGAATGVVLGVVACAVGNHYRLVSLAADVYSLSNIPFNSQTGDIAVSALLAFALSLVATIYPARTAARVRPIELLRDAGPA